MQLVTKTKSEEVVEEKPGFIGKLFKVASKDDMVGKKKDNAFDDFLKSDKTVKMTLKDGSATKKESSSEKFETYLKGRSEKSEPSSPVMAVKPKSTLLPVMERLNEGLFSEKDSELCKKNNFLIYLLSFVMNPF